VTGIRFHKREQEAWMLDPRDNFDRRRVTFEIRKDVLTGHISRVLSFRRKVPEVKFDLERLEASSKDCPFCPENIPRVTPKFPPEIAPEGRMHKGRACLFPNSFPYAQHSWVVVLCEEHFLFLDQFTVETLRDGFALAAEGIERVVTKQHRYQHASINWNYLPQSGAGLFHPHLQIVIDDHATASHEKVLSGLATYQRGSGSSFWEDYLTEEMRRGERYAGSCGDVHFVMAFSPLGILGEILILFSNRSDLREMSITDWQNFSEGLTRLFGYFKAGHIQSFNLSIFSGGGEEVGSKVYARLCPRMVIPPWQTSDINYFEKLHDEVICVVPPEEMCRELRPFFEPSG
jgi:UDPglucose--hexose-1-phosphate uridylyltransferase